MSMIQQREGDREDSVAERLHPLDAAFRAGQDQSRHPRQNPRPIDTAH
jgi:hypothetical protein